MWGLFIYHAKSYLTGMNGDNTSMETLGRNVREARHALGWSTDELASKAALEPSIIVKLERSNECSGSELQQISRALGIPSSILIPNDDRTKNEKRATRRVRWAPIIITAGFMLVLVKLMLPSLAP